MGKPSPFLKWAGGKRGLLHEIVPLIPEFTGRYIEPFVGAGAVLFAVDFEAALVNDFNENLIEVYQVIKEEPEKLIQELKTHENTKEHFLEVRAWDRSPSFAGLTSVQRAARFIYLNKTGFNGLDRVNSNGYFNVPFAGQKNPNYVAEENIRAASAYFGNVTFNAGDYRNVTKHAKPDDFVYLDPPYDPITPTASFVAYHEGGFGKRDQEELRDEIVRLTEDGVNVLLSNSDTRFIRSLYADENLFNIVFVRVRRVISAKASSRGMTGEVLVDNYAAARAARAAHG
jgi:DNA adenine methylase